MAIQIPNPGTGNGATGDNEFVLWSKVKDNFNDQTNAASKLLGTSKNQIPLVDNIYKVAGGIVTVENGGATDVNSFELGSKKSVQSAVNEPPTNHRAGGAGQWLIDTFSVLYIDSTSGKAQMAYGRGGNRALSYRNQSSGTWTDWTKLYTDANTTIDAGTGFLKASSPVLHVYNDKIDKIHEAEQLDITVDKKGVGHYEIYGTTGLRQNDGWNMSPPRDLHGNVRCMIEVTEKDGVITVKTYKRKFDLELAAIVHDYDNPLDIPEGACVELRFNDLPYDNLDDTQVEYIVESGKE